MPRVLTTLQGVRLFQSGVGDNDDLLVRIKEDPNGGWFSQIHKGFYYIGTEEGYQFARKGQTTFSQTTTGEVFTQQVASLLFDPTEVGPIILRRDGQVRQLQRVCSSLRAFRSISFTGSDPKSASVPNDGLLVSLISHPVTGIFLSVPSTGDIIANDDYYHDRATNTLYIRAANPGSTFATYVVDEYDVDLLRQEEIVRVDTDGSVRTQFTNVLWASGSALNPVVTKPTINGAISVTATNATGNVVTFDASGSIVSGDIVAVRYYVKDSYTCIPSGNNRIIVQYLLGTSGDFTLEYETGDTWYDTSQLASGHTDAIQLNPILEPRQSGFLYMVDSQESYPSAVKCRLSASNLNPLYNPSGCAQLVISVVALDAEGEPIPQQRITITSGGVSGLLSLAVPLSGSTSSLSGITNGLGQVLYHWTMQGSGLLTITATVSGTSASGVMHVMIRDIRAYTSATEQRLGKLLLHLEEAPFREDLRRLNAYYCYPDGVTLAPSGTTDDYSTTVTFSADKSQFYTLDGLPTERPVNVPTNADGIASILVDPIPGDVLRATVQTDTTGRIRTAAPVIIPRNEPGG
jgi:hypothetical protein